MEKLLSYLNEARGRRAHLASELQINQGAVSQWDRIPSERVLEVERVTGISRHDLRPDLYPREEQAA